MTQTEHYTEQARQLVKHISDAALELAFVRHSLTSDEFDESDYPDVGGARQREQALEHWWEEIKEDTLACLTGDDTGCLDPEELDESNCELLWTQSLLNRVAAEAATQGQSVGTERAIKVCTGFYERWQRLQTEVPSVDKQSWNRFSHIKNAAHEIRSALGRLNPDTDYLDRIRAEAATAALGQAARAMCSLCAQRIPTRPVEGSMRLWHWKEGSEPHLCEAMPIRKLIAAIGDDKDEHGNRD